MTFSDYFEHEPADYGLSEEAAQLTVDFIHKIEESEFDLEPTKPVLSGIKARAILIVVSFRSQRRRWQLWVTGAPGLKLTYQWLMSDMQKAAHTEMLSTEDRTPAAFEKAWELVQKVEAQPN